MAAIDIFPRAARLSFFPGPRSVRFRKEVHMAWKKPTIAVVCVGMEINSYASARR
jgi:coenzyme PQQ precursor peptide PqqA